MSAIRILPPANPLSMAQEGRQLFGGLASHSLHRLRNGSHENVASLGRDFLSPGSLGGKSVFAAR